MTVWQETIAVTGNSGVVLKAVVVMVYVNGVLRHAGVC